VNSYLKIFIFALGLVGIDPPMKAEAITAAPSFLSQSLKIAIMEIEVFKSIPECNNMYQVSNYGNVRSLKFGKVKLLNPTISKVGYYVVNIHNKKQTTHLVHRLVAKVFIPNPENKRTINHIDGNKLNNKLSNLEWATDGENHKHAYKTGLRVGSYTGITGYNNPFSKEVHQYHISGEYIRSFGSVMEAERYTGIGNRMISRCCRGDRANTHGFKWSYDKFSHYLDRIDLSAFDGDAFFSYRSNANLKTLDISGFNKSNKHQKLILDKLKKGGVTIIEN
jgi:hypothetical protein